VSAHPPLNPRTVKGAAVIQVDKNVRLEQLPEDVFDFLADVRHEPAWNPDVLAVRLTSRGPVGAGTTFDEDVRGSGHVTVQVIDYDRPHHITFAVDGPRLSMTVRYDLAPDANGTLVHTSARLQPHGAARLLAPVIVPAMRSAVEDRFASMQEALDHH
jgi:uncharacterized protein YndB with AHSA1/START domain